MVKGNEKLEIVTTQHPYSHEQFFNTIQIVSNCMVGRPFRACCVIPTVQVELFSVSL